FIRYPAFHQRTFQLTTEFPPQTREQTEGIGRRIQHFTCQLVDTTARRKAAAKYCCTWPPRLVAEIDPALVTAAGGFTLTQLVVDAQVGQHRVRHDHHVTAVAMRVEV